MHDGPYAILHDAVDHYRCCVQPSGTLDAGLRGGVDRPGTGLDERDVIDLVVFLRILGDP